MFEWQLRERLVDVLEQVAAGDPADVDQVAAVAAELLADLRQVWIRDRRWRNDGTPKPVLVHQAGEVIACREYRRSCPGYIVDQRQTCTLCGAQLVHGRWAVFYEPGAAVAQLGTITYPAHGTATETPCSEGEPVA